MIELTYSIAIDKKQKPSEKKEEKKMLLDVATWPMFLLAGGVVIAVVAAAVFLTLFAIKLIKKARKNMKKEDEICVAAADKDQNSESAPKDADEN